MDIEDLNKTQLLLLTLLVNFVTSIATAVLTVSLLSDTSPTVTQTVNRIVERTVESVAEAPTTIPTIITKEAPRGPTEEERRTAALAATSARTVEVYKNPSGKLYLATGTYLPKSRAVVAVASEALPNEVAISFPDGSMIEASKSKTGDGFVVYGFADTQTLPDAPSSGLVALVDIVPGQTVVSMTGEGVAVVGIVSKVDATGITTTLTGVPAGASVSNLAGNVIGISTGTGTFIPAEAVAALLAAPAS